LAGCEENSIIEDVSVELVLGDSHDAVYLIIWVEG
jgi:hypothetical protein